jgi:hypothetical protein
MEDVWLWDCAYVRVEFFSVFGVITPGTYLQSQIALEDQRNVWPGRMRLPVATSRLVPWMP